tara:strand:+ start:630 stop:1409 length:780 start_codon:yes stop_codon:yes gene_type:complete
MRNNKVAVVTGASSGIGAAVVKKLASEQCKVIMLARSLDRMKHVAAECNSDFKPAPIQVDLKDTNSVKLAFEVIRKDFKHVDILCAVAGIFRESAPIRDQADAEWDEVMETNLTGVMRCIRSVWTLLAEGSSIVTVGSVLGQMSQPDVGAYAVSKSGLAALTRTAASEGVARGIRANLIIPGMVDTPMNQKMANVSDDPKEWWKTRLSSIPMGRAAQPEEIAEAICWLAGDDAKFVTGAEIRLDGGALLGLQTKLNKKI